MGLTRMLWHPCLRRHGVLAALTLHLRLCDIVLIRKLISSHGISRGHGADTAHIALWLGNLRMIWFFW